MSKNSFELGQTDICKYLQIIAGNKFIYKKNGDQYKLYCYNGKFWENDDIIMRNCISTELYNFLKTILIEVYWNTKDFNLIKTKIEKLKTISYKKELIETYKEFGLKNDINFDDKWWLLGFNNAVYDMEEECFREYKYDDYVSLTCGYDWREPAKEEINTVNKLIESIMPIKEERDFFLQILCTALEGRCLEKFIIFNAGGRNGKGVINDLLLSALGNYGLLGNNGILFENSKTGSNPEKANIHKKRYVVFREPPEKNKFENSIIKELTGGGTFSARTHHEKETEKELNLTMVVECNKKPLFAEEPKDAEVHRIIDIYFRSTFTTEEELYDPENYIFMANLNYKTKEFQNKHKFALLKILMDEHKKYYKKNNSTLKIPKTIKERTSAYLEMSCNIVQWFKENYLKSNNEKDYVSIKDIYKNFTESVYWNTLPRTEKLKYNKTFFVDYIQNNIFFKAYFRARYGDVRTIIKGWRKKTDEEMDEISNE
jgi:phage/plasmid-associated DNA primase